MPISWSCSVEGQQCPPSLHVREGLQPQVQLEDHPRSLPLAVRAPVRWTPPRLPHADWVALFVGRYDTIRVKASC